MTFNRIPNHGFQIVHVFALRKDIFPYGTSRVTAVRVFLYNEFQFVHAVRRAGVLFFVKIAD